MEPDPSIERIDTPAMRAQYNFRTRRVEILIQDAKTGEWIGVSYSPAEAQQVAAAIGRVATVAESALIIEGSGAVIVIPEKQQALKFQS